jgi:hypothetical protein
MVASTKETFTFDSRCTGGCRASIHFIPSFVFSILRIANAAINKNKASTFNQVTDEEALSKMVSFQYTVNIGNKETLTLKSIVNGSFAVAVNHSKKRNDTAMEYREEILVISPITDRT